MDPMSIVRAIVAKQPWYKEFSNTVTAAVGALIGVVWLAANFGFNLPDRVENIGFIVIAFLTMIGVYHTPNGMSQSQLQQLQDEFHKRSAE